ncbi:MAG: ATP-binding cassette domain-containing protein, partial [Oscillospiraceae bacterium]
LPVGYMQFVEIAREIDKEGVKLLVFDEPTAVLTEGEADRLLQAIKLLSEKGIAILFITHRLDEVMSASAHITVIRDGKFVKYMATKDTNVVEIAQLMVGREVERLERNKHSTDESIVMSIKDLKVNMPGEMVKGVNLEIKQGEILGIGGLAGQGKIGIPNGIMGLYHAQGSVEFEGKNVPLNNPTAAIDAQIGFVSEDRRGVGLLLDESIALNMVVPSIQNQNRFVKKYGPISMINSSEINENADRYIKELDIRCMGAQQSVRRLSGGNQQKVCIAKALTGNPKIIFVSEPTRGIDIGAKKLVLDTLVKLNEEYGMTVVVTSSELAELRSVCDRIAIITEGKVAGILSAEQSDAKFGLLMSGVTNIDELEA